MHVKCLGGTLAQLLINVIVFCNCSDQKAFFFGWNAIVVQIPNPGQIKIEEAGGEEEKQGCNASLRRIKKEKLTTLTFTPAHLYLCVLS